jgi:hypothetical protein
MYRHLRVTVRTTVGATIRAVVDIDPRLFGFIAGWKL